MEQHDKASNSFERVLAAKEQEIVSIKNKLIEENKMFNEENQKELENQVMEFLGLSKQQTNASLFMSRDQIREKLNEILEQTNYSGA